MINDHDVNRVFGMVRVDCYVLRKFGPQHQMQVSLWMRVPDEIRARFVAQNYVRVTEHVVYLTACAVDVMGYRETLA